MGGNAPQENGKYAGGLRRHGLHLPAEQCLQNQALHRTQKQHGCRLQIGGSDQYGNITAGIELIRRKRPEHEPLEDWTAFGLVTPLITDATPPERVVIPQRLLESVLPGDPCPCGSGGPFSRCHGASGIKGA